MGIFKTVFLFLQFMGISLIAYGQWRSLQVKKKEFEEIKSAIKLAVKKWDDRTRRSFIQKDLRLNANAIPLEVIIANLSQGNAVKYLTAYPVIKFVDGSLKKSDIEKSLPKIREVFFEVINQKSSTDLLKKDGILKLKEDLLRDLNQIDLPLKIEKIYFLSAVIS